MRWVRLATMAGLVMFSGAARAQITSGDPGYTFSDLKQTRTVIDYKGKLAPEFGGVDKVDLELFVVGDKLSGSTLSNFCDSKYDDGKGRILYAIKGGPASGNGVCRTDSGTEDNFSWTSQSTASGDRFVVSGKGTATQSGQCPSCLPERMEITQQFTILVSGRKCTIEAYSERIVDHQFHPYLKTESIWTSVTTFDRGTSSCSWG